MGRGRKGSKDRGRVSIDDEIIHYWSIVLYRITHSGSKQPYDLHLQIYPNGDQFQIMADHKVGLSLCQSVIFIRDYEAAINFPSIKGSKIISRSGNKVLVERTVEDHILLISIKMRSIVQYKETSDQVLNF